MRHPFYLSRNKGVKIPTFHQSAALFHSTTVNTHAVHVACAAASLQVRWVSSANTAQRRAKCQKPAAMPCSSQQYGWRWQLQGAVAVVKGRLARAARAAAAKVTLTAGKPLVATSFEL